MKITWKTWLLTIVGMLLTLFIMDANVNAQSTSPEQSNFPVQSSEPVTPVLSPAMRDIVTNKDEPFLNKEVSLHWMGDRIGETGRSVSFDPLAANGVNGGTTPNPLITFEGLGTDGFAPPDTIGDVGPNHYVQMVNISVQIWDKGDPDNGIVPSVVLADFPFTSLYDGSGLTACNTENDGDPVVIYDDMADRWLLSQFAVSTGERMCIAVSQTPNPMGAYYLYQFDMPDFPDYFKFGAWSDAYYMSTNTGFPNQYYGYAFDRASMLAGLPATYQYANGLANFLMPADFDGPNAPPAGDPGIFYTMYAEGFANHPPGVDRIALYEFDVDWGTPANSTFSLVDELPIADYNYTVCGFFVQNCIPQPGTAQTIDSLSYYPMFRLQYRNFGGYGAMVGNFTVDLDNTNKAAIRWFEIRKTGSTYSLYQEGTYAPDASHRWMGSIAMDISGNIALGYSVSDATTVKPSIRYATRLQSDPLGTLAAEAEMFTGTGVQTGIARWGDYSNLVVDPVNGCHFWYTTEYHQINGTGFNWNTRIGVFVLPTCGGPAGTLSGQVTDSGTTLGISGADVLATGDLITQTGSTTTDSNGFYTLTIPVGTYTVTGSAYSYLPGTVLGVNVLSGTVTMQDMVLDPAPLYSVDGYVTDNTTGWPLYASISIDGYPNNPVWTNPTTGYYSVTLPGYTYTLEAAAWVAGYTPITATVNLASNTQQDFALDADLGTCTAPGYSLIVSPTPLLTETFDAGIPGSWFNIDNSGGSGCPWVDNDPGGRGNQTGGSGLFVINDSDWCGAGSSSDAELQTPVFDATGYASLLIEYKTDYFDLGSTANVDTYDGSTWVTAQSIGGSSVSGPTTFNLMTSHGGGSSTAQVRWHYVAGWDWWWEVDDVSIYGQSCLPPVDGGLVVGNVYNDNTGNPLIGASIENEDGYSVSTWDTPDDPAVEDGFYTIFSLSGSKVHTATHTTDYGADVQVVSAVTGDTVSQDFFLPTGWLVPNPDSLAATLELGDSTTVTLSLDNLGAFSVDYEIIEQNGGFTPTVLIEAVEIPAASVAPATHGTTIASLAPLSQQVTSHESRLFTPPAATLMPGGAVDVLLFASDDVNIIQASLAAFPGINTVDYYDARTGTPSLPELLAYDTVVVMSTFAFNDNVAAGEVLADYIDAGGSVVQTNGTFNGSAFWALLGRYLTDGYSPYEYSSNVFFNSVSLGAYDAGHPIMDGVTSVTDNLVHNELVIKPESTFVADWSDGQGLAATKGSVVGLNIFVSNSGNWGGDTELLLYNSILWLNRGSDIPWLSEDPITGTVNAGSNALVDVVFDASAVDQPGDYFANLNIGNNTPYGDVTVPVTMTVNVPATWGKVEGTATLLGYCDVNPTPAASQDIFIEASTGYTATVTTDENGYYTWWLAEAHSPITMTLNVPNHELGQASGVVVAAGQTTTVDFNLRLLEPCVSADPESYEKVVFLGDVVSDTLDISNDGTISTTFAITEKNSGILWLSEDPITGTLDASSSQAVDVVFDTTVLTQTGWYSGELDLTTNDPVNGSILIPINIHVVSGTTGLEMSPDQVGVGAPGEVVSYTFYVTNTGNVIDIYHLSVSGNAWATSSPPATTSFMDPGEVFSFTVSVEIPVTPVEVPENIIASDVFTVTAVSELDGTSASATGTTMADTTLGVTLASDQAQSGDIGTVVTYTLTLLNTGAYTDTYALAASGNIWATNLSDASVTLAAGTSIDISVTVLVEQGGSSDVAVITATSQLDAALTASATLTTTGNQAQIFLPIVSKE